MEEKASHRPFRFLKAWIDDELCFEVVKGTWLEVSKVEMESHKLIHILNKICYALKKWNKNFFGHVQRGVKVMEVELHNIQLDYSMDK